MGKYDRLKEYIHDYFPEMKYSRYDITKWAKKNVPAWKYIEKKEQKNILNDWEDFIAPELEKGIEKVMPKPSLFKRMGERFINRIKKFLGRWFGKE